MNWLQQLCYLLPLHKHSCGCGAFYLCSRPQGCEEPYICIHCETAQVIKWIADYERKHINRHQGR